MKNDVRSATPAIPALERGIAILEMLTGPLRDGASRHDIQKQLAIPQASAYRLLKTLTEARLISEDASTGKFRLGARSMRLGFWARHVSPVVKAAQPLLRELSLLTHQMSTLVVHDHRWKLMVLETWQTEGTPLRVAARPGMFFGLDQSTAPGLCYLTFEPSLRAEKFLHQIASPERRALMDLQVEPPDRGILDVCQNFRGLGYALQTVNPGNSGLAVPVYDRRAKSVRVAAALCIVCDAKFLTPRHVEKWSAAAHRYTKELEDAI